eukprot:scaffold211229_cov23-Tisochrysis_lutea.AAC.1
MGHGGMCRSAAVCTESRSVDLAQTSGGALDVGPVHQYSYSYPIRFLPHMYAALDPPSAAYRHPVTRLRVCTFLR